jgi:cold shock CspA family protein
MGRSKQTAMKKELESRRRNKRLKKSEKAEARKASSNKGKGFDSMIAYVDEMGKLSSTPPDPTKRREFKAEDAILGARMPGDFEEEKGFTNEGRVSYYNDEKGYGFIKDSRTKESLFFHLNNLNEPVKLNDLVVFEKNETPKGMTAVKISKLAG